MITNTLKTTQMRIEDLNRDGEVTFSEAALESARHVAQVPHPSSSGGLPANGLHAPVIWNRWLLIIVVKNKVRYKKQRSRIGREWIRALHFLLRAAGKAQAAQRLFWRWKLRRPHLTQRVWVLFLLLPKLPVPFPWIPFTDNDPQIKLIKYFDTWISSRTQNQREKIPLICRCRNPRNRCRGSQGGEFDWTETSGEEGKIYMSGCNWQKWRFRVEFSFFF